jgi:hypothetical protein
MDDTHLCAGRRFRLANAEGRRMTMSRVRIVGGWLAVLAVVAVVLGSLAYTSQGPTPAIQIEDSIPPFRG